MLKKIFHWIHQWIMNHDASPWIATLITTGNWGIPIPISQASAAQGLLPSPADAKAATPPTTPARTCAWYSVEGEGWRNPGILWETWVFKKEHVVPYVLCIQKLVYSYSYSYVCRVSWLRKLVVFIQFRAVRICAFSGSNPL